MKDQKFGIEIEFTGIGRYDAAKVIAKYFGTTEHYAGSVYQTYEIKDTQGRTWKLMRDSSIRPETKDGHAAGDENRCELVSTICN